MGMTNEETLDYFKKCNENLVSVAKDENVYNYEKKKIEADCMRKAFEANEKAIQALEQQPNYLEQIKWERDIAIGQLEQLGYSLGEKIKTDGDCISREQAVYVASGYCAPQNIADELRKLPSVTPHQTKWILVSERLPEKNGIYIASYEDAVALLKWFNGKWFFYPSNPAREETGTIIAWKPLPEPYKAENKIEQALAYADQETLMPAT